MMHAFSFCYFTHYVDCRYSLVHEAVLTRFRSLCFERQKIRRTNRSHVLLHKIMFDDVYTTRVFKHNAVTSRTL